jgi:hypothetical protein
VYVVGDIGTKDPADLILENKDAWVKAVEKKRHVIEVMLDRALESSSDERAQGKTIVSEVLPFVRAIQSPIDRAHFIRLVSNKSHIPEATLTEELTRGIITQQTVVKEETVSMPSKERLAREIIAFASLVGKHNDTIVTSLEIDFNQFPETIIQEEMFKLEERVIGDKDKYLLDLVRSYRRESHREKLVILQQKMRMEGADKEAILKEIYEHAKKGPEIVLGE